MAKEKKNSNKKKDSDKGKKITSPWTQEKLSRISTYLEKADKSIVPGKNLKNDLLSIQYRMEYYLLTNNSDIRKTRSLEEFLRYFLETLNIPFKFFALSIGTTDANLKKYLTGKRKFTLDLAMKFGAFLHTPPELWLNIQSKNDIIQLQEEKSNRENYAAYNYENFLAGSVQVSRIKKGPAKAEP